MVGAIVEGQRCRAAIRRLQLWSCGLTRCGFSPLKGLYHVDAAVVLSDPCGLIYTALEFELQSVSLMSDIAVASDSEN